MRTYRYRRLVHWSECDPAGIIFFPHYARWMVEGVNLMFLAFGVDPNGKTEAGQRGLPSIGYATRFHSPAFLHDRLIHEVRVTKLGTKSIAFEHRFLRGEDCVADATETRVWVNNTGNGLQSLPIPLEVRRELESEDPLHDPSNPGDFQPLNEVHSP